METQHSHVTDFTQQGPLVYVSQLCLLLNQSGLVVAWECATAIVPDKTFEGLIQQFEERMIMLSDMALHVVDGDPTNFKLCQRGAWKDRRQPNADGFVPLSIAALSL